MPYPSPCASCRFFVRRESTSNYGECHFNPPRETLQTKNGPLGIWPVVLADRPGCRHHEDDVEPSPS